MKTTNLFCPVTGLPVTTHPEWHHQNLSDNHQANFYIIGRSVICSAPNGSVNLETVRKSLALNDVVAEQIGGKVGAYVQIEDYRLLKNSTLDARRYFVEHMSQSKSCMALIFCNLSSLLRLFVKIGQKLNATNIHTYLVRNYTDAIEQALHTCETYHMETGTPVFEEKIRYDATHPSLMPVEILRNAKWDIRTQDYTNQTLLIDRRILHSASDGQFRQEHVLLAERMREQARKAIAPDSGPEYIVVDSRHLKGGSRKARRLYMRSLEAWHRQYPLRMYVMYGVNAFMRAAVYLAKPFMPFRVEVASDLNHAFELIRKDRHQRRPENETANSSAPASDSDLIEQDVHELLGFIGNISWEQEGDALQPDIRDDHPFSILFQGVRLIKDELDDLLRERKAAESELRKSEAKYRELFEKGSDLLCFHDLDGNILETNLAFKKEYGWHETESLNLRDMICPRYRHVFNDYIERIRRKGKDRGTLCIVTKDGREIILEYNNAMVCDVDGNPLGIKGSSRDITAQIHAARENRRLQEELRQQHKMDAIATLAGGIAHNFNNMLGVILGNAEMAMADMPESATAWDNLEEIRNASLRAKDMVRQLMILTQMKDMKKERVRLRAIVESSLNRIRESVPRSIEIHTYLPIGLGEIMADPSQIRQIFIHLCTNAVHAMEDNGGSLTIHLSEKAHDGSPESGFHELPPGRYLQLKVSDTGHGITQDIRERIFDPYFTTKDVGKGAGMGLAVVQGLVRKHDGAVSIDSEAGKGTTVTVLFPRSEECEN